MNNEELTPERTEIQARILSSSQQDVGAIRDYCKRKGIEKQDRIALDMLHTHYRITSKIPDKKIIDEMFSEEGESELEVETSQSGLWDEIEVRLSRDPDYREKMFQLYLNVVREILPRSD